MENMTDVVNTTKAKNVVDDLVQKNNENFSSSTTPETQSLLDRIFSSCLYSVCMLDQIKTIVCRDEMMST